MRIDHKDNGIRAILLDVDGVIVGDKLGVNYPLPHPDVIARLQEVRENGVYVSLCTAKPLESIAKIVFESNLNNLHISDGGSVITNPFESTPRHLDYIDSNVATIIMSSFVSGEIYHEAYSQAGYYVIEKSVGEITAIHASILGFEPIVADDMSSVIKNNSITKLIAIASNEQEIRKINGLVKPYDDFLTLKWGIHPVAMPYQFGVITSKSASKENGANYILNAYSVLHNETLAVGDSVSDWSFMHCCGFVATVDNSHDELKKLVSERDAASSCISPSVNDNGIISILNYFGL